MIRSIAKRWRLLSGQDNWNHLLDPFDIDLRRYLIHYGERAQATYDTFNSERASAYAGTSRYARKNLFSRVGLDIANPYKYKATKYLYATSQVKVPESFILKPWAKDACCKDSNWMGYVAVTTDEGKVALGRRDILIAWRGTIEDMEWVNDFNFPLVSASKVFGEAGNPKVHEGYLSIYTSVDPASKFNKTSARDQVLLEVKRLLDEFQNEEMSITVTGHSLGAALGMLSAADIVVNGLNKPTKQPDKQCPVTAFLYGGTPVGDSNFRDILVSKDDLHILRVSNVPDVIPSIPMVGYSDVGEEMVINTQYSNYLKNPGEFLSWHNLEVYLHGIAGSTRGGFNMKVKRDIKLMNKSMDIIKDEYLVPIQWWGMQNKGMVQVNDGSWKLEDHEKDEFKL